MLRATTSAPYVRMSQRTHKRKLDNGAVLDAALRFAVVGIVAAAANPAAMA